MVFEKRVPESVQVLRELCSLIPPLPIPDLSFKKDKTSFKKTTHDWSPPSV
jgi:hypothetical protein